MKLKDYFIEQKQHKISENEKFFLYEKIISQKTKKTFFNIKIQNFVNIKSFAYGFMMIILLVGIYGVYFFNGDFSYEGFMVQNNTNLVSADYIAKVIDFNGNFYIKHNGKYYKTNKISNGDNVILKKGSEIIFDINSGTQAKIIGPAKFSLQEKDQNYQLLVSEGDFIKMESIQKSITSMEIILNDITVSSENNINLLITKKDNEYKINNQGDKIIVTKDNNIQEIEKQQLLAIKDNDITLIKNIEDFGEAIVKQNLSQTFAISEEKKEKEKVTEMFLKEINEENDEITEIGLAQDLGLLDNKQIPTKEQTKELYATLNNEYLLTNIEGLYKNNLLGNQKEYSYILGNLEGKIDRIYKTFNINISKENITNNIKNLKEELENKYHIPIKYTENLQTISNRIQHIQTIENGSNTNTEEVDQLWQNIKTNPPSNLVFK